MDGDDLELGLRAVDEDVDALVPADRQEAVDVAGVGRRGHDERRVEIEEPKARRRHIETDDSIAVRELQRLGDFVPVSATADAGDEHRDLVRCHFVAKKETYLNSGTEAGSASRR